VHWWEFYPYSGACSGPTVVLEGNRLEVSSPNTFSLRGGPKPVVESSQIRGVRQTQQRIGEFPPKREGNCSCKCFAKEDDIILFTGTFVGMASHGENGIRCISKHSLGEEKKRSGSNTETLTYKCRVDCMREERIMNIAY